MNGNLFNKLCQVKTLLHAWTMVKQKGTSGGVDGKTIADVDADIGNCILSIKDKIVQQAIKQLIEPRFEKVFVINSYL